MNKIKRQKKGQKIKLLIKRAKMTQKFGMKRTKWTKTDTKINNKKQKLKKEATNMKEK